MIIKLKHIEPFNLPNVDNLQAKLFIEALNGYEEFKYEGQSVPKSLMIYSLKYNHPKHSFADGYLLSISIDEFTKIAQTGQHDTLETMLKGIVVGRLHIEFYDNLSQKNISYNPFNPT